MADDQTGTHSAAGALSSLLLPLGGILDPARLLGGSLEALGLSPAAPPQAGPEGFSVEVAGVLSGRLPVRGILAGTDPLDLSTFRGELRMEGSFHELEAEILRLVHDAVEDARGELDRLRNRVTAATGGVDLVLAQEAERLTREAERRRTQAEHGIGEARRRVDEVRGALAEADRRIAAAREAVARERESMEAALRPALEALAEVRARAAAVDHEIDQHEHWYRAELDDAGRFWNAAAYAVKAAAL
jgi:chromosome segregation ATPase